LTSHAIAQPSTPYGTLFFRRIWGLMLRHYYLHSGSWPRIVEMLYWPVINMVLWGFTSAFLIKSFTNATIVGSSLIASVLLVEVFVRVSTNLLVLFLEEIWSRNLGHLFASPLTFSNYIGGITLVSFLRTIIAMTPAILLALFLFDFSLFSLGWPVTLYIALLAFNGCWYGLLLLSLLLRFGLAAEWVAWMGSMLLTPLIAPYYPVSVLPHALQMVSYSLPATYVFESVKAQLNQQPLPYNELLTAFALNVMYFIIASVIFWLSYRGAQKRGGLLQVGE
jgi:ABC-2 type transport system permease protein